MTSTSSVTTTSQLMTISPSGVASSTTLPNPANGTVIPDGNGGALVQNFVPANQNQRQVSTQVIDAGGSNPTATISNFAGDDTVLGDQGTYFMTDGNHVVCVDEASGNEKWRWQPESGTVEILAATAGGGVAVKNIVGNQEDVVRLDASGNPTYDTWGTSGGQGGYGVLSNSTYFNTGLWAGTTGDPVIAGVEGEPLEVAASTWAESGGTEQKQGSSDPGLVLIATQDCHKVNDTQLYARYPIYQLSTSTTKLATPTENYTVFEFIPGQKSRSTGVVCTRYGDLDPCGYGDRTAKFPFNEFDDEISVGLYGGETDLRQYFLYGLPNQRLYGVKQIYRTIQNGSVRQPQLKQPNVSWNQLHDIPRQDPLIDGHEDPWLAPWDGTRASCDSYGSIYFPQQ